MSDKITVTMVETVTYQHEYTVHELAELLGLSTYTAEAIEAALANNTTDELDTWLLEDIMEHFQGVEDREWSAT